MQANCPDDDLPSTPSTSTTAFVRDGNVVDLCTFFLVAFIDVMSVLILLLYWYFLSVAVYVYFCKFSSLVAMVEFLAAL